ncbi:hypothetical protein [Sandaracinus amylolyticus]|uniref:Bacterial spore germination immunoglobulin-like domain-containing protein n=1 Tax=Sandaracinus amylolyticus TaxID=927083 RepID=A0A0F6W9M8_9BACT|nr:hypothetical protein [Sandaracinus amylolyticus]AKF10896.1 hypothetical protein DB32_008045 [Sandaracinus amylolyticus]
MRGRTLLIAITCALTAAACGTTPTEMHAEGTQRVPAAKAEIDVEMEGTHRDVDVQVSDLPEPQSLGEDFSRYGVWMIPSGGAPQFVGFLRYQSDIEYGELETRAPLDPVEIVVTAERGEIGTEPSDVVVLRRRID